MVYRIYAEKKPELAHEASGLTAELKTFLQIQGLEYVRVINRYDVENIEENLFETCKKTVFSEPQQDLLYEELPLEKNCVVFAVEYLPGQFDQRADSAAQCIQIISQGERPLVRTAKVYLLYGRLSQRDIEKIKKYVINPVESREAALELPKTLAIEYEIPTEVPTVKGFLKLNKQQLAEMITIYGFAMDIDDIQFCQQYFAKEQRDPTITELRMIDTYWSDHCRHTTFLTTIDKVHFEDTFLQQAYERYLNVRKELGRTKPINLMDIGTLAARYLSEKGMLPKLDESEEINACTVKIEIEVNGQKQPWLLLFKNETHNHPTEIEPFGGAATCIGGAIRDPLSGRSYVYAAMRVTGAADPLRPIEQTLFGKLPQRKIVTTAAAGYSSYGNQIGLATGQVDEIYHDGYAAKHMEIGAVLGAAPAENVRRERPVPGDVVILLGGRTGRDGCGGATGSSKSHTFESLENCGAEVQKGNAPEERKLQRLFRNKQVSLLIKRCNDFGAGGVSVAIGELADGLCIDLNAVPKKYEGLDGTELAISESQERMAVVVAKEDAEKFIRLANEENLEATKVAEVTEDPRLIMYWNGKDIVNISREFLNSNGAEKHITITPSSPQNYQKQIPVNFTEGMFKLADDLNVCSKRGLAERFDSTIGAGSVFMPFGGSRQLTPIQAMVHKIPVEHGETNACSFMAWGYNPMIAEKSPYHGAYLAVVESVSKLIAAGASFKETYLTFQEYFEKPLKDGKRWGKPFSALLGAFQAQLDLGIAAIGGKDSMSGSFEQLDVPPTLVSFAVTMGKTNEAVSNHFKQSGNKVVLLSPEYGENELPKAESLIALYRKVHHLLITGKALTAYTPVYGGVAEALMKMCFGEGLGFDIASNISLEQLFGYRYGSFILEMSEELDEGVLLGKTTADGIFSYGKEKIEQSRLLGIYEGKLEPVYPCNIVEVGKMPLFDCDYKGESTFHAKAHIAKPRVLIPVFPGTNCEYDTAKAWDRAGAETDIFVINNLNSSAIRESAEAFASRVSHAQIVFIPGGFSGGDEPDGSGKFITAFFRNAAISEEVTKLLEQRDGLMAGICNGFQALIKLGLVPYGKIVEAAEDAPTLTYNTIGRHQSRLVRTRVSSNHSPWLMEVTPGEIYTVPISHGEGKFIAKQETILQMAKNGQIITQYVDAQGKPTYDVVYNPNGSYAAIEGIISPDGRVLGKMGHSERIGFGLYQNVPGRYEMGLFTSAVKYFL